MCNRDANEIVIEGARANNLKDISLRIPHNQLVVVTGVSGSGKSSLVFDIIAQEGQRRYFETLPSFTRQFLGKLNRPDVDKIHGLSPVIAIGQKTTGLNARSTVGTMSDIYALLRLLYARTGTTNVEVKLSRSLFSFNSDHGKCSACSGIGKQEQIDLNKLVANPEKSIRDGALAPTLPNGYIMYSQVTIDVLNQVCEAEGFNVDIPWNELSESQRHIILHGSEKIKVPFGKHSLESRLKWTGIKAKPREEGYYKGMIPIMSDILRRDRNANILKFVHAVTCTACNGERLNQDALSVRVQGSSITTLAAMELNDLAEWLRSNKWGHIASPILEKIGHQISLLMSLGLGHLSLSQPAKQLSASEVQRIRVANQLLAELSGVLYIFDEPSIGLHSDENRQIIAHLRKLVENGNTVIVVEHDLETIRQADWIIDVGPEAGTHGGELIFNGPFERFITDSASHKTTSPTYIALNKQVEILPLVEKKQNSRFIELLGCTESNLKNIDVRFQLGGLNIVSGKAGTGKTGLVRSTLERLIRKQLEASNEQIAVKQTKNAEEFNKLIFFDQSPIGRTPRSNPATYLGISNRIRDVYALLPDAKSRGYKKSRFSFNTKGGRCEACQGAGKTQIGMHFLGNIDITCGECNGKRFNDQTLEIEYKGKSIAEVYRLSVNEALSFFKDEKKVVYGLQILNDIGLGYLSLGQSSTTLSGGEAQRLKIANQLQKKDTGKTLYIIMEPSIGLHHSDLRSLLVLFDQIKQKGNTIVCIEQDEQVIAASDWHIELGPETGKKGGSILYQGKPKLRKQESVESLNTMQKNRSHEIILEGVQTHNLKGINVRIPKNELTVVTGLSGSGKSSLVFDTLFAEANTRFTESLSTYNRSFIHMNNEAKMESSEGLGPAIALNRSRLSGSKRSTVGTLSGVYDSLRLLFARLSPYQGKNLTAQSYSFNHHIGACKSCNGLGTILECDPKQVIQYPEATIFEGALRDNKALNYYGDQNGQFMATLKKAAGEQSLDIGLPWNELSPKAQKTILYGTVDIEWEHEWEYKTKTRSGTQKIKAKWLGLCHYIDDEFERKRNNKNTEALSAMLHDIRCDSCNGSRLQKPLLEVEFREKNIHELSMMSIGECLELLESPRDNFSREEKAISEVVLPGVIAALRSMVELGLGYLSIDRPVKSLSGGERQRVALAGQLSSQLYGVTYVLDEPTIGLDSMHVQALLVVLRRIIAIGNTVVVVEHDRDFIDSSDYLIELGPNAGGKGGEVIYQGARSEIKSSTETLTYKLLYEPIGLVQQTLEINSESFGLCGGYRNNLKDIDVSFRSGLINVITGISGSGKSTLLKDVLFKSWKRGEPEGCKSIFGFDQFDQVHLLDQELFFANALSSPATYTRVLEKLKSLYSKLTQAKELGLKRADFSYQSKIGRCPTCSGYGQEKTSLDFMGDIWSICNTCDGKRYSEVVLACKFNDKSIGDSMELTVDEAIGFFEDSDILHDLKLLQDVGVGHVQLGQAGNTLSGGEGQRLKLAKTFMEFGSEKNLYLFDEPSTGLHYFDVLELIKLFRRITEEGHTIIYIEHNATLIDAADTKITLGPGSGDEGGKLI